ncbi:hypothetical protein [Nonomuraea sp. NPDC049784]|uniref:hypothetical protein n=1 Tax=Nonomuraea sp. NPDC049784 TaxID=3154361 RepID=UPI0033F8CAB7
MEIDVVLPCLNEEAALPWVLGRMPPGFRPIVVDNGSTDGSARVATEFGAMVVTEPRPGFGAAVPVPTMPAGGTGTRCCGWSFPTLGRSPRPSSSSGS